MKGQTKNKRSITANQCRKIHALKNSMALTDEEYRSFLMCLFGVDSSTALTFHTAGLFIEEMEKKAVNFGVWTPKADTKQRFNKLAGRRRDMATPAQLRLIESLWLGVSHSEDTTARAKALQSFVERTAKVSNMRFLTREGATKVINGLNAMQRQIAKSGIATKCQEAASISGIGG